MKKHGYGLSLIHIFLLTDVMKETSYVMLSGKNAEQVLMQAFKDRKSVV